MQRCLQLAAMGAGRVAPNPMVGAVLVYNDVIIGEGYHQLYGQPHAEVNCINSVAEKDKGLIKKSTLYVSLEPCAHWGKTPPCADLIIRHKIPKVVIACRDSYKEVDGRGMQKLYQAGVSVELGVSGKAAEDLNKRFFTFHTKRRPYIILKWAQSKDDKIAAADYTAVKITGANTNRLVHKWRSEEAAIMVGTTTAKMDNPSLTNRLWHGNNPVRLVVDKALKLSPALNLFDQSVRTIVFNEIEDRNDNNVLLYKIPGDKNAVESIIEALYTLNIQSVLVEGGAALLQSFIEMGLWDEARVITNNEMIIGDGIKAPILKNCRVALTQEILRDTLVTYLPL